MLTPIEIAHQASRVLAAKGVRSLTLSLRSNLAELRILADGRSYSLLVTPDHKLPLLVAAAQGLATQGSDCPAA